MPFELELDDVDDVVGVVLADAPPDELELWVDWVVELLDEPEEFEPHAATPRATSTRSAAAQRRGNLVIVAFINGSFGVRSERIPVISYDAGCMRLIPEHASAWTSRGCGKEIRAAASFTRRVVIA